MREFHDHSPSLLRVPFTDPTALTTSSEATGSKYTSRFLVPHISILSKKNLLITAAWQGLH